jgi:hypothetical protein
LEEASWRAVSLCEWNWHPDWHGLGAGCASLAGIVWIVGEGQGWLTPRSVRYGWSSAVKGAPGFSRREFKPPDIAKASLRVPEANVAVRERKK